MNQHLETVNILQTMLFYNHYKIELNFYKI